MSSEAKENKEGGVVLTTGSQGGVVMTTEYCWMKGRGGNINIGTIAEQGQQQQLYGNELETRPVVLPYFSTTS